MGEIDIRCWTMFGSRTTVWTCVRMVVKAVDVTGSMRLPNPPHAYARPGPMVDDSGRA